MTILESLRKWILASEADLLSPNGISSFKCWRIYSANSNWKSALHAKNVAGRVKEVSKINYKGEDAPTAVVWPSQLERSVKHSVRHIAYTKE